MKKRYLMIWFVSLLGFVHTVDSWAAQSPAPINLDYFKITIPNDNKDRLTFEFDEKHPVIGFAVFDSCDNMASYENDIIPGMLNIPNARKQIIESIQALRIKWFDLWGEHQKKKEAPTPELEKSILELMKPDFDKLTTKINTFNQEKFEVIGYADKKQCSFGFNLINTSTNKGPVVIRKANGDNTKASVYLNRIDHDEKIRVDFNGGKDYFLQKCKVGKGFLGLEVKCSGKDDNDKEKEITIGIHKG